MAYGHQWPTIESSGTRTRTKPQRINPMFNPTQTLASFNETVRFCDEMSSDLFYVTAPRQDVDFEMIRLNALHAVMNHGAHQSEF